MNIRGGAEPVDPTILEIVNQLGVLSARDRELVLALISRLRCIPMLADQDLVPDVPFMDFDE